MTMRFEFQASIDTVFKLMTDPDFLVERSLAIGELEASCEVEDFDDKTEIRMQRVVKRELPSFLAKLFSSEQSLNTQETWLRDGDNWAGQVHIEVADQPVSLKGEFSLKTNTDTSCIYEIAYKAKANIPLIGGKVEKYIASQTNAGIQQELDFASSKLQA